MEWMAKLNWMTQGNWLDLDLHDINQYSGGFTFDLVWCHIHFIDLYGILLKKWHHTSDHWHLN